MDPRRHREHIEALKEDIRRRQAFLHYETSPETKVDVFPPASRQVPDLAALESFFDKVVLISNDNSLLGKMHAPEWPFRRPEQCRLLKGLESPEWWQNGEEEWNRYRTHVRILENALTDGVESVLVLEDPVRFIPDFPEAARTFLNDVPGIWHQLYLGGRLEPETEKNRPVNSRVVRTFTVHGTFAYAVHQQFLKSLYRSLTDCSPRPNDSLKTRFVELHRVLSNNIYAPHQWLVYRASS
jgi:hypothetical protein